MPDTGKQIYSILRYLSILEAEHTPCTIFLMNGFQIHQAVLIGHDSNSLLMEVSGRQQVVYKQTISTILPGRPVHLAKEGGSSDA